MFDGLARPALWPIWPGGFVNGAERPVPEFDPAAAAKLLDEAGWLDTDKDGIRDKDGDQLRFVDARRREAGATPMPRARRPEDRRATTSSTPRAGSAS